MMAKVFTISEICTLLGISKGTAYGLIHSGKLKHFRIGRSIRITEEALNLLITGNTNRNEG